MYNRIRGLRHEGKFVNLFPDDFEKLRDLNGAQKRIYISTNIIPDLREKINKNNNATEIIKLLEKWLELPKESWDNIKIVKE